MLHVNHVSIKLGDKKNNRIKLILFMLLCFTHILNCKCAFILTGTFAIWENTSKAAAPGPPLYLAGVGCLVLSLTLPTWLHPSGFCQKLWKRQNSPQWGLDQRQLWSQMTGSVTWFPPEARTTLNDEEMLNTAACTLCRTEVPRSLSGASRVPERWTWPFICTVHVSLIF